MAVLVKEVMIKDIVTLSDKATIGQAIEIFAEKEIGCLPMVDENGNLTAFLSDGDIVYYVVNHLRLMQTSAAAYGGRLLPDPKCTNYFSMLIKNCVDQPAYDAATHRVVTINEDQPVRKAAELMQFAVSPAYFSVKYSKQQKIGKAVLVFPIFHSIG